MKTSLLRSVAAGGLFIGAVAMPVAGYVGSAMAQSNNSSTTQTTQKPKPDNNAKAPAAAGATKAQSGSAADASKPAASAGSADNASKAPASKAATDKTSKAPADQSASNGQDKGQKIVTEQKDTEVLASTYIGQSVYNSNDKSIGDISDLVFDKSGGIKAAVVGVGGFLGIGQKDVAVTFDRIKIQRKPNSADVKLVTDITADQLKKAPAFKNLQAKMDEQNASKSPAPAAGGTGMGMGGGAAGGAMGTGGGAGTGGSTQ